MVGVVVDRPVGEDHVGPLGLEDLAERLVMLAVDHGIAVNLPREERPGLEDLARLAGLGDADAVLRLPGRHAVVQVEQNDFVPQVGIAGDGAAAAVFGIAGMAAGDDHLPLAARRIVGRRRVAFARLPREKARPSSSRRRIGGMNYLRCTNKMTPGIVIQTYQRIGQPEKRLMDLGRLILAEPQPPEVVQPRQGPLHVPAMFP